MKALCGSALCCLGARKSNHWEQSAMRVPVTDRPAFRELVERLQSKVFFLSYALLGNVQQADEAAQKIFATVHRKHCVKREGDDLRWIYQLTVDQCLNTLRTRRLRKFFAELMRSPSGPQANELAESTVESHQDLLVRALSNVPDRERALLALREVADQPIEDIAVIMRMDSSAVRRRLFVARRRFLASWSLAAEK